LSDASDCPETLVAWFVITHLTITTTDAGTSEEFQHTTQLNLELMWIQATKFNDNKNNKNTFCLSLANETQ
jgi:hypothetical protein